MFFNNALEMFNVGLKASCLKFGVQRSYFIVSKA